MILKTCKKCGENSDLLNYHKGKTIDGYKNICKICCNKTKKEYDKINADKIKLYRESLKNSGKRDEYLKKYNEKNKEQILVKKKEYRNSDNGKLKTLNWKEKNKNYFKEHNKKYYPKYSEKNKEIIAVKKKIYRENNKIKIEKYRQSPEYKQKMKEWRTKNKHIVVWRNTLRRVLRVHKLVKIENTIEYLGYDANEFKQHIQNLFTEGMSWGNHGEWHVDHIKQLNTFDKNTPPNIINALSNLRPLWATTREINGIIYEGNLNRLKN